LREIEREEKGKAGRDRERERGRERGRGREGGKEGGREIHNQILSHTLPPDARPPQPARGARSGESAGEGASKRPDRWAKPSRWTSPKDMPPCRSSSSVRLRPAMHGAARRRAGSVARAWALAQHTPTQGDGCWRCCAANGSRAGPRTVLGACPRPSQRRKSIDESEKRKNVKKINETLRFAEGPALPNEEICAYLVTNSENTRSGLCRALNATAQHLTI
jgi:hypothetical protein